MRGARSAAAALVVALFWSASGMAGSLSARFVLVTSDTPAAERISGTLRLLPGGGACLVVATPLRQEMRLSPKELVIYYPDRDLALVGTVSPRQAPPMFEALTVAIADPAGALPRGSTLLERRQTGGVLVTRWRVAGTDGGQAGEMRIEETREGASLVEVLDRSGRPQRRFAFANRLRVGGRSVPRAIDARYFAAGGATRRHETWTLDDVAAIDDGSANASACARLRPTTKVQELPW